MLFLALLLCNCWLSEAGSPEAWSDPTVSFNITKFQGLLTSQALCRSLVYRLVTETTMDLAARELREGAPHGTLVLTEEMTKGRGRTGGKWISRKDGNLYLTLLLRAAGELNLNGWRRAQANFATPLAVAEAIRDVDPKLNPMIRWPRAVEIEGRKVSGSLIEVHEESGVEHFAVGIGVNVNADFCSNTTFSQDVTSLRCMSDGALDREQLLARLCDGLDKYLRMRSPDELKSQYLSFPSVTAKNNSVSLHNKTTKQQIGDGVVVDITLDMNLIIAAANGSRHELSEKGDITVFPRGRSYKTEL